MGMEQQDDRDVSVRLRRYCRSATALDRAAWAQAATSGGAPM
jgi:hypothetical protein